MMSRVLQVATIVSVFVAITLTISALATSSWMKVCMKFSKIYETIDFLLRSGKMSSSVQGGLSTVSTASTLLQEKHLYFQIGLFSWGIDMPSLMSYSFPVDIGSTGKFIKTTAGFLIAGVICLVVGKIVVVRSVLIESKIMHSKSSSRKNHKISHVVITIGATFLLIGMLTYTIAQAKTVHNPLRFFSEIGAASQQIYSRLLSKSSAPYYANLGEYGIHGRKKHHALYPLEPGSLGLSSDSLQDLESQVKNILQNVNPVFGYSFYLAWVAVVMALIAVILARRAPSTVKEKNYAEQHVPLVEVR
ncbi:uncharacterized protein LOC143461397 [Clavelina lepadiformis]|uniref:Uncharacterized protein n=1 Tax=Clavelina lepadiformis TaxID=159417 RepID=A0ABP0H2Y8_CLALP